MQQAANDTALWRERISRAALRHLDANEETVTVVDGLQLEAAGRGEQCMSGTLCEYVDEFRSKMDASKD